MTPAGKWTTRKSKIIDTSQAKNATEEHRCRLCGCSPSECRLPSKLTSVPYSDMINHNSIGPDPSVFANQSYSVERRRPSSRNTVDFSDKMSNNSVAMVDAPAAECHHCLNRADANCRVAESDDSCALSAQRHRSRLRSTCTNFRSASTMHSQTSPKTFSLLLFSLLLAARTFTSAFYNSSDSSSFKSSPPLITSKPLFVHEPRSSRVIRDTFQAPPPQSFSRPQVIEHGHELFVLKLELGVFACQVNSSQAFLQVFPLSKLCDGYQDCYEGSDEDAVKLRCNPNRCKRPCEHGVCLDSGPPFNSAQCHCDDGYMGCQCEATAHNQCKDRPCDTFATCTNAYTSHYCTCLPGFRGGGSQCTDIDECADPQFAATCGPNADCCNVPGSYACKCRAGFTFSPRTGSCVDLNECAAAELNDCGFRAICQNEIGSYKCLCPLGFEIALNKDTGRKDCIDIDECLQNPCARGAQCVNNEGSYQCLCSSRPELAFNPNAQCPAQLLIPPPTTPPRSNDFTSLSVRKQFHPTQIPPLLAPPRPCEMLRCGPNAQCTLISVGVAICQCLSGYQGVPDDINIGCQPPPQPSTLFTSPIPTPFPTKPTPNVRYIETLITCPPGFRANHGRCVDIDECAEAGPGAQPCARGAVCSNTIGSFECRCPAGLAVASGDAFNLHDECVGVCTQQRCGPGAHCIEQQSLLGVSMAHCVCPSGSAPIRGGNAINGCQPVVCPHDSNKYCGPNSICRLQTPKDVGFMRQQRQDVSVVIVCECAKGFEGHPPDTECRDINECLLPQRACAAGAICTNTPGAYQCQCPSNMVVVSNNVITSASSRVADVYDTENACRECPHGYDIAGSTCVDVNECLKGRNPCSSNGICSSKAGGSYACTCDRGYELVTTATGPTCVDINECATIGCAAHAKCTNIPGSYICECVYGDTSTDPFREECRPQSQQQQLRLPSRVEQHQQVVVVDKPQACEKYPCFAQGSCDEGRRKLDDGSTKIFCACLVGFVGQPEQPGGTCTPEPQTCDAEKECGPNSQCQLVAGLVLCYCQRGFVGVPPMHACQKPNVCGDDSSSNPCAPGECVAQGDFAYSCHCPLGFQSKGGQCLDVNECIDQNNPCAPGYCHNTLGSYSCQCPPSGYRSKGGRCTEINECVERPNSCAPGQCINEAGGFRCVCPKGYVFTNGTCTDIDECALGNPCRPGECLNTPGGFKCTCPSGFSISPQNGLCKSIDECAAATSLLGGQNPCGLGTCIDMPGKYNCICPKGYQFIEDENDKRKRTCVDIDECVVGNNPCAPYQCRNLQGSFECECPRGMLFKNGKCEDIDECAHGSSNTPCGAAGLECINRSPARDNGERYVCHCHAGFRFDGITCIDINECAARPTPCGNGVCVNRPGSYMCQCPQGFEFINGGCNDINECLTPELYCAKNAQCTNLIGGYECQCQAGTYRSNEVLGSTKIEAQCLAAYQNQTTTTTTDSRLQIFDSCSLLKCSADSICRNGECKCSAGLVGTPGACRPGNCDLVKCGVNAECRRIGGSDAVACICLVGFEPSPLGECVDVDECARDASLCSQNGGSCWNTIGSYQCKCKPPYKDVGGSCVESPCDDAYNPCTGSAVCVVRNHRAVCECQSSLEEYVGGKCRSISTCEQQHSTANPCGVGQCLDVSGQAARHACVCPSGYRVENGTCVDIDECAFASSGFSPCNASDSVCTNLPGSYKCECPAGLRFDGFTCQDINECLPNPCGFTGHCKNIRGSFLCECSQGYNFDGKTCVSSNECLERSKSGKADLCAPGVCVGLEGGYTCTCPSSHRLIDNTRCVAISKCGPINPCKTGTCVEQQTGDLGYRCVCPQGYTFDGRQCRDVNECQEFGFNPCEPGTCWNLEGSYKCACPLGFAFRGGYCVNINECVEQPNICGGPQNLTLGLRCIDTIGSYICECPVGYQNVAGRGCVQLNECLVSGSNPCAPGECQKLAAGSYRCQCPEGFEFRNGECAFAGCSTFKCPPFSTCRDDSTSRAVQCVCYDGYQATSDGQCQSVSQCQQQAATAPCSPGTCVDLPGRFTCTCPSGYQLTYEDNKNLLRPKCIAIDLCAIGNPCQPGTCSSISGRAECKCPAGFRSFSPPLSSTALTTSTSLLHPECRDIDECVEMRPPAMQGAACINTAGSFLMLCPSGYTPDVNDPNKRCIDINECQQNPQPCLPGTCWNMPGTYKCKCPHGYQERAGACVDINECLPVSPCVHGDCVNVDGGFYCKCFQGYQFDAALQTCVDINECANDLINPCLHGGTCVNTPGSYVCQCPAGFRFNGVQCEGVNECLLPPTKCPGGQCVDTIGSYKCVCPSDYELLDGVRCVKKKSVCELLACGVNAICDQAAVTCRCREGMVGNPTKMCEAIPTCNAELQCGPNTACTVAVLDKLLPSFEVQCQCRRGYRGTPPNCEPDCPPNFRPDRTTGKCIAINECVERSNPCRAGTCIPKSEGGYTCLCPPGTSYAQQENVCVFNFRSVCVDSNPCGVGTCVQAESGTVGHRCLCPPGYVDEGDQHNPQCARINECVTPSGIDPCAPTGVCVDGLGGYTCRCLAGYSLVAHVRRGDRAKCIKVNECITRPDICGAGATCQPDGDGYICLCPAGYDYNKQLGGCVAARALSCPLGFAFDFNSRQCVDINECAEPHPPDCGAGQCENTIGSYACVCPSGFTNVQPPSGKCVDIEECTEQPHRCDPGVCIELPGSFRCECPTGYRATLDGRCQDINECVEQPTLCLPGTCQNTPGSFFCVCPVGFRSSSTSLSTSTALQIVGPAAPDCVDINECVEIRDACGAPIGVQRCINTIGSYQCVCRPGFRFDAGTHKCININECIEFRPPPCLPGQCVDTIGSFECICPIGFTNTTQFGKCLDVDECVQFQPCNPGQCINTIGSYECVCPLGMRLLNNRCVFVNECEISNPCAPFRCVSDQPGYHCECPRGFQSTDNGRGCVSINACVPNPCVSGANCLQGGPGTLEFTCRCPPGTTSPDSLRVPCRRPNPCEGMSCFAARTCTNVPTASLNTNNALVVFQQQQQNSIQQFIDQQQTCVCVEGYDGMPMLTGLCSRLLQIECPRGYAPSGPKGSEQCINIDECVELRNPCQVGRCIDTPGAYRCECPSGYRAQINQQTSLLQCVDVNECVAKKNPCLPGTCFNEPGSYRCQCPAGYRSTRDGRACEEVFVCRERDPCAPGTCLETGAGQYQCVCPQGFTFDNGISCVDIDECQTLPKNPCLPGDCTNTFGSFECTCPQGYKFQDGGCIAINACLASGRNPCLPGQCVGIQGSYRCTCPRGFAFFNGTCADVNECEAAINPCGDGRGRCENTIGSYQCRCAIGFEFSVAEGTCVDINECRTSSVCTPGECINTIGSFFCNCPAGFRGLPSETAVSTTCVAVQACVDQSTRCGPGTCLDEPAGQHRCICERGYQDVRGVCIDINECSLDASRCQPGQCRNLIGSFTCDCPKGYAVDEQRGACVAVNQCDTNPDLCAPLGTCVNTPGSFKCVCPTGYEPAPNATAGCVGINECAAERARGNELCAPGNCENVPGGYHCSCPTGYNYNGRQCVDIDECLGQNPCIIGRCINIIGSYTCECLRGYRFVDGICRRVDECEANPCAGTNEQCISTIGSYSCLRQLSLTVCQQTNPCQVGRCIDVPPFQVPVDNATIAAANFSIVPYASYKCECPLGYRFNGATCVNVDECVEQPDICGPAGSCRDLPGSYFCICDQGYRLDAATRRCVDINECAETPRLCKPGECINTPGSFHCQCPLGFRESHGVCQDINECVEQPFVCGLQGAQTCINTIGSYQCVCQPGYELAENGTKCVDVNECSQAPGLCLPGACENLPGSFRCLCPLGYEFNRQSSPLSLLTINSNTSSQCVDINECIVFNNPCGPAGQCKNTVGSYECRCSKGYEFSPNQGTCVDINECGVSTPCGPGTCQNLPGTYRCFCIEGYKFIEDGTCVNINECVETPRICAPSGDTSGGLRCIDKTPGYECVCDQPGFRYVDAPTRRCISVRETCVSVQCGPGAACIEYNNATFNGVRCECAPGYVGNPLTGCRQICELPCLPGARCVIRPSGEQVCECQPPYIFDRERGCLLPPIDCSSCAPDETCRAIENGTIVTIICERCQAGFRPSGDRRQCIEINECLQVPSPCVPPNSLCINKPNGLYECVIPPVLGEAVPLPDIDVHCVADGIEVVVNKASQFNGVGYVKGRSREPECSRIIQPDEARVVFKVDFGTCGIQPQQDMAEFVFVVQRHPTLVTVDATAYNIQCRYKSGEKIVTALPFPVSMVTTHGTIANSAPPPLTQMRILDQTGQEVQSSDIGEPLTLKIEITHNDIYGAYASACYARTIDDSWRYQVTNDDGCSKDPSVFGEWYRLPNDNALYANFSAFKFPENNIQRFQCNVRVCFGPCPAAACGQNLQEAFGKRRRRSVDDEFDNHEDHDYHSMTDFALELRGNNHHERQRRQAVVVIGRPNPTVATTEVSVADNNAGQTVLVVNGQQQLQQQQQQQQQRQRQQRGSTQTVFVATGTAREVAAPADEGLAAEDDNSAAAQQQQNSAPVIAVVGAANNNDAAQQRRQQATAPVIAIVGVANNSNKNNLTLGRASTTTRRPRTTTTIANGFGGVEVEGKKGDVIEEIRVLSNGFLTFSSQAERLSFAPLVAVSANNITTNTTNNGYHLVCVNALDFWATLILSIVFALVTLLLSLICWWCAYRHARDKEVDESETVTSYPREQTATNLVPASGQTYYTTSGSGVPHSNFPPATVMTAPYGVPTHLPRATINGAREPRPDYY